MSIRDSINKKSDKILRRLSDTRIQSLGREVPVVRVRIERDMYNDQRYTPVLSDRPHVILHFPMGIPIDRYRQNSASVEHDESRVFMFDILPVELYTKWEDKVEKGDFLVYSVYDENESEIPILLRVAETLGSFKYTMVWKQQQCAPYNGELMPDVMSAFENLEI